MDTRKMWFVSMTVTLVLLSTTGINACNFPSFMQNSTDRDWRSGIRDQFTDFTVQVVVSGNIMHVTSTDTSVQSYRRFCVMRKPGDKYLVAHEEAGQSATRYTCMQFVKRSHNVVQLRVAGISRQMDGHLCDDDNMVLDGWILIDRSHIAEDRQMCPLRGGFSIVIYDKVRSRGICDSYQGHTRLESECVNGEGLLFHFRDVQCVPEHVYMYAEQRTLCLAHWQEGLYTFMLIKHDRDNYIWMFRYQTFYGDQQHGNSFVAFLLNDLVAETGNQLTTTNNYVRLSCARDQPVLVTSLCVDDYEICSHRREPCPQSDQMALTCPRSCGVCNASRPTICHFPAHLQRQWREMAHSGAVSLSVNTSSLTIHGHMDEMFHCIQWDPTSLNSDSFTENMLVTDYQNGCKPRYSCARFLQNGSNTLFFGISESKRWPITSSLGEAITCGAGFHYVQDTTLYPNPFRGKHTKLLFSGSSHSLVPCGLPEDMQTLTADLRDGTRCTSTISESPDGTVLLLTMSECSNASPLRDLFQTSFMCMESSRIRPNSDLLIISRTSRNPGQTHCWLFPKKPQSVFYLVEGAHCNEETKKRIRKGRLIPLAKLTKLRRQHLVQAEVTSDITQSLDSSTTLPPGDHVTRAEHDVLNNRTQQNRNHTGDSVDGKDVKAAPFVVVGALLFFAALQIPCGCRSS